jgi:molecular chaperone HtpG
MSTQKQQFQIYLPGLLKVLAESLYSTKKVAIRELIQNAHDGSVRRTVEQKEAFYQPRIHLRVDPLERTLTIQDNGSGLAPDEVTDYLSTIGRSYTRQLGEDLSVLSPDEASRLIGQFGLGFLSSFLIASEVVLLTRSIKEGSPALRWSSTGDIHYDVTTVPEGEIGTTVELKIKPGTSFILNEEILLETVRQYADFLPVPIFVGDDPIPVNIMRPPWEALDPEIAMRDYIGRVFKTQHPLAIIPLSDQTIDLGHDSMTIPLRGFLFVPPGSLASIREYGDLMVFIRKMFICEQDRDLLPTWARFVRGVIDCPELQPTASREEVQRDDAYTFVQQALEEQLIAGLRRIAQEDPTAWKAIVRGHTDVIMGWAVQDNEFFQQVADLITFRTSRGQMSLPEYLKTTNNTIYFVTKELGSLQEQVLGEGHGLPVIEASWFAVTPFIQKYAFYRPGVRLVQLDGESNQLLRPVSGDAYQTLLAYYRERGIKAIAASFKPPEVPAIITYPKDAEFIAETRSALDADEIPGPFADLVNDYLGKLSTSADDLQGTLYLNVSSELVQKLAALPNETLRGAALDLLYQVARLFAGRMLGPQQAIAAFKDAAQAIGKLAIQ